MTNNERKKEQEYLKKQLLIETFQKSDEDFSSDRVDGLVRLLEANEPTDPDEIEESQRAFEAILKKKIARKPSYRIRKLAQAAAIICLLLIGADITTEAMFNENIFRAIQKAGNWIEVIPSDTDVDFNESETSVFTSIESFDAVSDGDFLFCSWLPDGFYFSKIKCVDSGEYVDYYWIYSGDDSKIEINIYDKKNNEINSFTPVYNF